MVGCREFQILRPMYRRLFWCGLGTNNLSAHLERGLLLFVEINSSFNRKGLGYEEIYKLKSPVFAGLIDQILLSEVAKTCLLMVSLTGHSILNERLVLEV